MQIDARALVVTLLVSVLIGVIFRTPPMFKASRPDINEVLKAGAKSGMRGGSLGLGGPVGGRGGRAGAGAAIGAGLMIRSFGLLVNVNPGFDPENVLTGRVSLTRAAYEDHEERLRYVNRTLERLRSLPGVQSAAFVAPMPFSGGNVSSDFRIEGRPRPEPGQ